MANRDAHDFDGLFETHPLGDDLNALQVFLCIDPKGAPILSTLRTRREESIQACFGEYPTQKHIDERAREGWRCVPMTLGQPFLEDEVFIVAAKPKTGLPKVEKGFEDTYYGTPERAQEGLRRAARHAQGADLRTYRAAMRIMHEVEVGTVATSVTNS